MTAVPGMHPTLFTGCRELLGSTGMLPLLNRHISPHGSSPLRLRGAPSSAGEGRVARGHGGMRLRTEPRRCRGGLRRPAFAPRRNAAFVSAAAARPCVSQREISEGRWQMPAAELCPTSPVTGNCSPRVNGAVPWGPGQGETGADISDDRYIFTFFHPHPDFTWS